MWMWEEFCIKMIKIIYSGLVKGFWREDRFRSSLEKLGGKVDFWFSSSFPRGFPYTTVECGDYLLSDVRVSYKSDRWIPPFCSVALSGEETQIGEVERIILAEQDRLDPKHLVSG